jgi:hypothetical protein
LANTFSISFCFRRLQVVEQACHFPEDFLRLRRMFLANNIADVAAIYGVDQMILALQYRGLGNLHQTSEVWWIEASKALADVAGSRCRCLAQLLTQSEIARHRRARGQLVDS